MNQRQVKGKEITEKQNQIRRLNKNHYEVKSQSRNQIRDVVGIEFRWSSKFHHNASHLLKMGKDTAKKIPSIFVTDGLASYNKAFEQECAPKNDFQKPSKHIRDIHFKHQLSNNNIQEIENEIRNLTLSEKSTAFLSFKKLLDIFVTNTEKKS